MSKKDQVYEYLKTNKSITSWDAIQKFRATRLSAIIFDLKAEGKKIITERVSVPDEQGKEYEHYARYHLVDN